MSVVRCLLLIGSLFWAYGPGTSALADDNKRDRLLNDIAEALSEKNYRKAIPKMKALHAFSPDPAVLFNIGVAYEKWGGHCADALKAFDQFMAACGTCSQRETGAARMKSLRAECGPGRLEISAKPNALDIEIDGKDRGVTPLFLELAAGAHVVKLTGDGGAYIEQQIVVSPNSDQRLALQLPAAHSETIASTEMSARALVGWSLMGAGALSLGGVGITLMLENGTYSDYQKTIQPALTADPSADQEAIRAEAEPLDEEVSSLKNTAKILAGLGVALSAAGAYLVLSDRLGPSGSKTSTQTAEQGAEARWSVQVAPNALGIHGVFP